ncbi:hypothetical protein BVRB_4g088990 [Beta vulgaris subsp. vulgaris]|uniref:uncharacterized protein LOC104891733 n=1 Tax=Beta vulgaris subsp. vulgaris TaxID=3555 RepID=UPI00053FE376|nr:uncharacterized protein LOC104891733 [Beta vulgaris subsp. vulgaris]KMT12806.1 hypothetical protein BVRB_4g088990 [Beta vulgaris subsp. vulgaris]
MGDNDKYSSHTNGFASTMKPTMTDNDSNFIYLKFVNQKDKATHLKVVRNAKLQKAFDQYCKHHHLEIGAPRFFYGDGTRLPGYVSPLDLQLPDGAEIHVFTEMNGGAPISC